ncbi:DUF2497 domain-containing protein [Sphingobium sp. AP49]|uniref:DUF2497 domain-containing protein n=1 Tax=Sphingobium sp. AP49 TaxID=1144307 RepID=UPI00026EE348|nr:DUF2497 domain-containing protein [Sphingobium sp. AP49]WHO40143.1 DUF2497 domain-containing protein [Sphingobium sp. AP49]
MGDMTKEPSMEEILSSIKRIIAEEGEEAVQAVPQRKQKAPIDLSAATPIAQPLASMPPAIEEVLELTDEISLEEPMPAPKPTRAAKMAVEADSASDADSILSVESEVAARHSLSALSSMLVTPREGEDNTLEALVRAMLRPMLKEWLDARLPALVEEMVAKEISRITGR